LDGSASFISLRILLVGKDIPIFRLIPLLRNLSSLGTKKTWYDDNWNIYGSILNKDGSIAVPDFPIAQTSSELQQNPKVAYSNDSSWIVVWAQGGDIGMEVVAIRECTVDTNGKITNIRNVNRI